MRLICFSSESITGNDGTRINGQPGPLVVFQDRARIPDDLKIQLNYGSNQIKIDGIHVGDDISIYTGARQDAMTLNGVTAGDRITVKPGAGDDLVRIIGSNGDAVAARSLFVYASGGDNTIGVSRLAVSNDIYLRASGGDDVVSVQEVRAGDDLRLYGSTGDDTLAILDSSVADDTTLEAGPRWSFRRSSDTDSAVILNSTHNDRVNIDLASGQDFIGVREIAVSDDVFLRAGSGADEVGIQKSAFGDRVSLDGGSGSDGLLAEENSFSRDPSVKSFARDVKDFDAKVDAVLDKLADAGVLLPQLDSITEIVVNNDNFSTLEAAVVAAGLAETLASDGEFTVFAPTNAAFDALPDGTLNALLADPEGQLKDILLYHAVGREVFAADLVQLSTVQTLLGNRVTAEVTGTGVVLNGSVHVTATDIVASNGVIHVLDAVLIPPGSITEIVVANDDFSTLQAAVVAAGLAETLDGAGDFTVFAPTNAAFEALPEGTLDALLADPEGQLTDVLLYHVAGSEIYAADIVEESTVKTLLGSRITVEVTDSGVVLNGSVNVIATDVLASNGVIHVIDAVLLPPGSISDIVVGNDDFSTLEAAVIAAGLADTLDGDGSLTVFAPTNAAFEALPPGTLNSLLADPEGQLKEILLYHAAGSEFYAADVVQTTSIETLLGPPVSVEVTVDGVLLNGDVNVTATDIVASNGVIHVIDAVLLPPQGPAQSIAEIVAGDDNFETLLSALETTGLTDTLAGEGTFTVFAPTDDAFAKLPRHMLSVLTKFGPDVLRNILLYHVTDTLLPSQDLVELDSFRSLLGRDVHVSVTGDGVVLNGKVHVSVTDIEATNGVIHVIDTVLLPTRFYR